MPPTEISRSEPLCCRCAASFRSSSVLPAATHACAITTVRVMPRAATSTRMRAVASPRTDAWLRSRGTGWPASESIASSAPDVATWGAAAWPSAGRPTAGSRYGTP